VRKVKIDQNEGHGLSKINMWVRTVIPSGKIQKIIKQTKNN
jgi:hypothetical protein